MTRVSGIAGAFVVTLALAPISADAQQIFACVNNNSGAIRIVAQGAPCRTPESLVKQWLATNYVLLLYVAIFLISAHYFSRTDVTRNWLGILTIVAFVVHWWTLHFFQRSIEEYRSRLVWIYRTYFGDEERVGLDLRLEPKSYWYQPEVYVGILAVLYVGKGAL